LEPPSRADENQHIWPKAFATLKRSLMSGCIATFLTPCATTMARRNSHGPRCDGA
jgi:hypothetical protein